MSYFKVMSCNYNACVSAEFEMDWIIPLLVFLTEFLSVVVSICGYCENCFQIAIMA